MPGKPVIPFHEKFDTNVNSESFTASKFFNCELRIANCELVLPTDTTLNRGIFYCMFTRTELELLTLPQLKILCNRYGLKPTSSGAYKDNYITALMAFPHLAVQQLVESKGLKKPSFDSCQHLGVALDEMSEPTTEQIALIRISMEGRRMEYTYRYEQE